MQSAGSSMTTRNQALEVWLRATRWDTFGLFERCVWQLTHVGLPAVVQPMDSDVPGLASASTSSEPAILKVVCNTTHQANDETSNQNFSCAGGPLSDKPCVGAETSINFCYSSYRVVICLQLSPSLTRFDSTRMCCGLDSMIPALDRAIAATLLDGRHIGVGTIMHVMVVVRGLQRQRLHVLLSLGGISAGEAAYKEALSISTQRMREVLAKFVAEQQTQNPHSDLKTGIQDHSTFSTDAALSDSMFCLDQMPKAACPVVIFVADGTLPPPETATYANVVTMLQEADVACSIISIAPNSLRTCQTTSQFGVVVDLSSLQRLASTLQGGFSQLLEASPEFDSVATVSHDLTTKTAVAFIRSNRMWTACPQPECLRTGSRQFKTSSMVSAPDYPYSDSHKRWEIGEQPTLPICVLPGLIRARLCEGFKVSIWQVNIDRVENDERLISWQFALQMHRAIESLQISACYNVNARGILEPISSGTMTWAQLTSEQQRSSLTAWLLELQSLSTSDTDLAWRFASCPETVFASFCTHGQQQTQIQTSVALFPAPGLTLRSHQFSRTYIGSCMNRFVQHMLLVDKTLEKNKQLASTIGVTAGDDAAFALLADLGQHVNSISDIVRGRCFHAEKIQVWLRCRDQSASSGQHDSTLVEKNMSDMQILRQQLEIVCSSWCLQSGLRSSPVTDESLHLHLCVCPLMGGLSFTGERPEDDLQTHGHHSGFISMSMRWTVPVHLEIELGFFNVPMHAARHALVSSLIDQVHQSSSGRGQVVATSSAHVRGEFMFQDQMLSPGSHTPAESSMRRKQKMSSSKSMRSSYLYTLVWQYRIVCPSNAASTRMHILLHSIVDSLNNSRKPQGFVASNSAGTSFVSFVHDMESHLDCRHVENTSGEMMHSVIEYEVGVTPEYTVNVRGNKQQIFCLRVVLHMDPQHGKEMHQFFTVRMPGSDHIDLDIRTEISAVCELASRVVSSDKTIITAFYTFSCIRSAIDKFRSKHNISKSGHEMQKYGTTGKPSMPAEPLGESACFGACAICQCDNHSQQNSTHSAMFLCPLCNHVFPFDVLTSAHDGSTNTFEWNGQTMNAQVSFGLSGLIQDACVCERKFAAPSSSGEWCSPFSQGLPAMQLVDSMMQAIASVCDLELQLSSEVVNAAPLNASARIDKMVEQEEIRYFVKAIGAHRILICVATAMHNSTELSLAIYECRQPRTGWQDMQSASSTWMADETICIDGLCPACGSEGFVETSDFKYVAGGDSNPMISPMTAWFVRTLDHVYQRVFNECVAENVQHGSGVLTGDLQKALQCCVHFHSATLFPGVLESFLPLRSDAVHRHCRDLWACSAVDLLVDSFVEHLLYTVVDGYPSSIRSSKQCNQAEVWLAEMLFSHQMMPFGQPSEGLYFCMQGSLQVTATQRSRDYKTSIPDTVRPFLAASLSGDKTQMAPEEYAAGSWLRACCKQNVAQPLFCALLVRASPNGEAESELQLDFDFFSLLPIVDASQTELIDANESKVSVQPALDSNCSSLLQHTASICSHITLQCMPVHTIDRGVVTLVAKCMDRILSAKHPDHFVTRQIRLQSIALNSADKMHQELTKTNLLNLQWTFESTYLLLQMPNVRLIGSRVQEPVIDDPTSLAEMEFARECPSLTDKAARNIPSPFWCLIDLLDGFVQVRLYSSNLSMHERSTVLERIHAILITLSKRVDVNFLLHECYESRICSPLLFKPVGSLNDSAWLGMAAPDNGRWQVDELTLKVNAVGRYRFPLVHAMDIFVNHRVDLHDAMAELSKMLRPFKISNRERAFIYKTGDHFHYLLLAERGDRLRLEAYGIDSPSEQLIASINSAFRNRLDGLALEALHVRLHRNLQYKIVVKDVEFVCGEEPTESAIVEMPLEVVNMDLFLCFLNENLTARKHLHPLQFRSPSQHEQAPTPAAESGVVRDLMDEYGRHSEASARDMFTGQVGAAAENSLLLFYQHADRLRQNASQAPFGTGIAFCLITTAAHSESLGSRKLFFSSAPWPASTPRLPRQTNVVIYIWATGSVDTVALIEHIGAGVHQSLHEYCLDVMYISTMKIDSHLQLELQNIIMSHHRCLSAGAPSVSHTTFEGNYWYGISVSGSSLSAFISDAFQSLCKLLTPASVRLCIENDDGTFRILEAMDSDPSAVHNWCSTALAGVPFSKSVVLIAGVVGCDHDRQNYDTFYQSSELVRGFSRSATVMVIVVKGRCYVYTYNWNEQRIQFLRSCLSNAIELVAHQSRLLLEILTAKMGLVPLQSYTVNARPRSGQVWPVQLDDESSVLSSFVQPSQAPTHVIPVSASFANVACVQFASRDYKINETAFTLQHLHGLEVAAPWARYTLRDAAVRLMTCQLLAPKIQTKHEHLRATNRSLSIDLAKEITAMLTSNDYELINWFVNTDDEPERWFASLVEPVDYTFLPYQAEMSPIKFFVPFAAKSRSSVSERDPRDSEGLVADDSVVRGAKDSRGYVLPRKQSSPSQSVGISSSTSDRRRANASRRSRVALVTQSSRDFAVGTGNSGSETSTGNNLDDDDASSRPESQLRRQNSSIDGSIQLRRQAPTEGSHRSRTFLRSPIIDDTFGAMTASTAAAADDADVDAVSVVLQDPFFRWMLSFDGRYTSECNAESSQNRSQTREDKLRQHFATVLSATRVASSLLRRHLHQSYLLRELQAAVSDKFSTVQSMVDIEELEFNIDHAAKLLHARRWPLLFNKNRRMMEATARWTGCHRAGQVQQKDVILSDLEAEQLSLHWRLLENFLCYYTDFLHTYLAFELVAISDTFNGNDARKKDRCRSATIEIENKTVSLAPTRVYLKKSVDGIVLVLRLSFDQFFVCADLFSPMAYPLNCNTGVAHMQPAAGLQNTHDLKVGRRPFHKKSQSEIIYAGSMVNETLQLQSFLYDFHLQQAAAQLLHPAHSGPVGFDILGMCMAMTQHHPDVPYGANSRIEEHSLTVKLKQTPLQCDVRSFVEFLGANPEHYGCRMLMPLDECHYGLGVASVQPPASWRIDIDRNRAFCGPRQLLYQLNDAEATVRQLHIFAFKLEETDRDPKCGDITALRVQLYVGCAAASMATYVPKINIQAVQEDDLRDTHAGSAKMFITDLLLRAAERYAVMQVWNNIFQRNAIGLDVMRSLPGPRANFGVMHTVEAEKVVWREIMHELALRNSHSEDVERLLAKVYTHSACAVDEELCWLADAGMNGISENSIICSAVQWHQFLTELAASQKYMVRLFGTPENSSGEIDVFIMQNIGDTFFIRLRLQLHAAHDRPWLSHRAVMQPISADVVGLEPLLCPASTDAGDALTWTFDVMDLVSSFREQLTQHALRQLYGQL